MKQRMVIQIKAEGQLSSRASVGFLPTPSDAVWVRQMKQGICAKRNSNLTPNETGTMRQMEQRKGD